MFDLDFKLQVYRWLHSRFRDNFWVSWLSVMIHPITTLGFSSFRKKVNEELKWGRSKIQVEAFLRERFNEQNIFLETHIIRNFEFLVYPESYAARTPIVLPEGFEGDAYIVRPEGEELQLEQSQLTVFIPSYLQVQEDQLRVYLKKFLHAGFIYQIQYT